MDNLTHTLIGALIGETAAQMLLDLIRNKDDAAPASAVLPVELVVRASTGTPAPKA